MIERTASINTYYPTSMTSLRASGGRIGIPVKSNVSVYANFNHVYGVPSPDGMSLLKARAMDVMIDRMINVKTAPKSSAAVPDFMPTVSPSKTTVQATGSQIAARYASRPVPSGQFVNLFV